MVGPPACAFSQTAEGLGQGGISLFFLTSFVFISKL
jgi:hypothetical protein